MRVNPPRGRLGPSFGLIATGCCGREGTGPPAPRQAWAERTRNTNPILGRMICCISICDKQACSEKRFDHKIFKKRCYVFWKKNRRVFLALPSSSSVPSISFESSSKSCCGNSMVWVNLILWHLPPIFLTCQSNDLFCSYFLLFLSHCKLLTSSHHFWMNIGFTIELF